MPWSRINVPEPAVSDAVLPFSHIVWPDHRVSSLPIVDRIGRLLLSEGVRVEHEQKGLIQLDASTDRDAELLHVGPA